MGKLKLAYEILFWSNEVWCLFIGFIGIIAAIGLAGMAWPYTDWLDFRREGPV